MVGIKKVKNVWGVPHFLPNRPETEDDASIDAHLERMKEMSQLDPGKRNAESVATLMTKTFADRRSIIVTEGANVAEVLDKFPLLFTQTEMVNEFARITDSDLSQVFVQGLDKYAHKLVMLKPLKKEDDNVKNLRLHIAGAKTESERLCK